jgi:hypothetical protein
MMASVQEAYATLALEVDGRHADTSECPIDHAWAIVRMRVPSYAAFDWLGICNGEALSFSILASGPDEESLLVDARELETFHRKNAEWAKTLLDGTATRSLRGNKLYPKLAYKFKSVQKAEGLLREGPAYTRYFVLPIVREKTGGGRIILSTIVKRLRSICPPIRDEKRSHPLSTLFDANNSSETMNTKKRGKRWLSRLPGESEWRRAIEIRSRTHYRVAFERPPASLVERISSRFVYAFEGKHEGSMLFATRKYRAHAWEKVEERPIACGPTESVSAFMSDIRSILAEAESPWDSFIREWLEAFTLSAAPIVDGLVDRPDPVGAWSLGLWWEPIYLADRNREIWKEYE